MSGPVRATFTEGSGLTLTETVYRMTESGARGPAGPAGATGATGAAGADGRTPTRNDLGTISGPVNIDASYTETTGAFTAGFTATLTNFAEATPSNAFTFTVSGGGTPTMTLYVASMEAIEAWTTLTLIALVDGDYRLIVLYNGTKYAYYLDKL